MTTNAKRIRVDLTVPHTPQGLISLAAQWESQFPYANFESVSGASYTDNIILTLVLPQGTRVVQPQLIDVTKSTLMLTTEGE